MRTLALQAALVSVCLGQSALPTDPPVKMSELPRVTSAATSDYITINTDIGGGVFKTRTITIGNLNITAGLGPDLQAIEALSGTNTMYYRSAANTWSAVSIGSSLSFSGGAINTAQGLRTADSPTFAGLTISGAATAPTAAAGNNSTTVATTAYVQGERPLVVKVIVGDYTVGSVDPRELYGGVLYVTVNATITIPLAASSTGAHFTVITFGDVAVSIDPQNADQITLDGTNLSPGDKISNSSTSGNTAVITYLGGIYWYATTDGSWVDGN